MLYVSMHFNFNKDFFFSRIAVIPVRKSSFNGHAGGLTLGLAHLKERHLQILGYHVVLISNNDWHKIYMNLPDAKEKFLKNKFKLEK